MRQESLSAALEREHHEIDSGFEAYVGDPADRASLARAVAALRRHIYLEEEFLFPPLRDRGLSMPLFVMVREHGELWRTMDALEESLAAAEGQAAATATCRTLLEQLDRHNSKEEPVIYPQADAGLSDADTERLHELLKTGQVPAGWVCEHAGEVRHTAVDRGARP